MTSILQYVRQKAKYRDNYTRKNYPSRIEKSTFSGLKALYLGTDMEAWGNRSSYVIRDEIKMNGRKEPKNLKTQSDIVKVEHIVDNFFLVQTYYSIGD